MLNRYNRITPLKWVGLLPFIFLALFSCSTKTQPPNIILIQADDLGFSDLAIHGNLYVETPALDALAKSGMQFSRFYVNSVCAPTRASLLTGRHFLKTGVSHVHGGKDFIHLSETLLPQALKENGYVTGMWGKWHSGKTAGYFPWERGFDEAYMAQLYKHKNSRGHFNGREVSHEKWAGEVITDYAIDFMWRSKINEQPFFAYLSHLTVHAPLEAPDHLIAKYEAKGLSKNLSTLYGMVEQMDSCIGVLVNEVEKQGLAENTIILFMSDNGPAVINNLLTDEVREIRYANDYKGHKGNLWENGVKSPLFIHWEGTVNSGVSDQLLDITDIFPTLVQLAGGKLPGDNLPLDGVNFSAVLQGDEKEIQKSVFNWVNPGWPPTDRPWTPEGIEGEYQPINKRNKKELQPANQLMSVQTAAKKLLQNPGDAKGAAEPVNGLVVIDMRNDPKETTNQYNGNEKPGLTTDLHDWFGEVTESPHSFSSPVFLIGKNASEILGYGPVKISDGLTNTAFYLSGWEKENAEAVYRINVLEEGNYKFKLQFSDALPENTFFQLEANNRQLELTPEESFHSSAALFLVNGEQEIHLRSLPPPNSSAEKEIHLKAIKAVYTDQ